MVINENDHELPRIWRVLSASSSRDDTWYTRAIIILIKKSKKNCTAVTHVFSSGTQMCFNDALKYLDPPRMRFEVLCSVPGIFMSDITPFKP